MIYVVQGRDAGTVLAAFETEAEARLFVASIGDNTASITSVPLSKFTMVAA